MNISGRPGAENRPGHLRSKSALGLSLATVLVFGHVFPCVFLVAKSLVAFFSPGGVEEGPGAPQPAVCPGGD